MSEAQALFEASESEEVNSLAVISIRQVAGVIKTDVFGSGIAMQLADAMIKFTRSGFAKAAELEATETAVPETERCGENAEPASESVG